MFYQRDGKMFRVNVTMAPTFKAETPVEIADGVRGVTTATCDVDCVGKRLLLVKQDVSGVVAKYNVVLNWIEDVEAHVGRRW